MQRVPEIGVASLGDKHRSYIGAGSDKQNSVKGIEVLPSSLEALVSQARVPPFELLYRGNTSIFLTRQRKSSHRGKQSRSES